MEHKMEHKMDIEIMRAKSNYDKCLLAVERALDERDKAAKCGTDTMTDTMTDILTDKWIAVAAAFKAANAASELWDMLVARKSLTDVGP